MLAGNMLAEQLQEAILAERVATQLAMDQRAREQFAEVIVSNLGGIDRALSTTELKPDDRMAVTAARNAVGAFLRSWSMARGVDLGAIDAGISAGGIAGIRRHLVALSGKLRGQPGSDGAIKALDIADRELLVTPNELRQSRYIGFVLDGSSRSKLLGWWEKEVGIPLFQNVVAHHATILFGPSPWQMGDPSVGDKSSVRVIGWAADDRVQVAVISGLKSSRSETQHVTVALAKGTASVYSNTLLKGGFTKKPGPTLSGEIRVVQRK
jgi:hypothetical protein